MGKDSLATVILALMHHRPLDENVQRGSHPQGKHFEACVKAA